jgi:predicted Zn finger-like uncharacterized protein
METMPILLRCDNCHKQFKLDDDLAGRSIRCPRCQETVHVRGRRHGDDDDRPRRRGGSSRTRNSGPTAIWITLGAGGAALVLAAVAVLVVVGRRPATGADNFGAAPVEAAAAL